MGMEYSKKRAKQVRKKKAAIIPKAGPIKVTKADGTVEIQPVDPKAVRKTIKKGQNKAYKLKVDSKPVPKGRPRMTRYGRVFTPATTLNAEAIIAQAWNGPKYEGLVEVDCMFTPEGTTVTVTPVDGTQSKLRGDIDNYVKLLMDGLNGVAWLDDKQVIVVRAEKR
jgi:crossover junction endodeoxyribonuclease RusA